jgi:hypothetical protein
MERKIVDYTIIEPTDEHGNLTPWRVRDYIDHGWQPLGSLCAYNSSKGNNQLYQVMVKYESNSFAA